MTKSLPKPDLEGEYKDRKFGVPKKCYCRTIMRSNNSRNGKKKGVPNPLEVEMESIEVLEKILAEKVENDAEWQQLEIGYVKPIYVGKHRKSSKER
jgi:hypothetical protein